MYIEIYTLIIKSTLPSQRKNNTKNPTFTDINLILDRKESTDKTHKVELLKTALSEYIQ